MDGNQVLAHNGHRQHARYHQPFCYQDRATIRGFLGVANLGHDPSGQQCGQARTGDRHGKRTQQRVAEGNFRPTGQAILERHHGGSEANTADETTNQRPDKQGNNDMHPGDGQDEHHEDGNEDSIHTA